jgi:hypothetical protein
MKRRDFFKISSALVLIPLSKSFAQSTDGGAELSENQKKWNSLTDEQKSEIKLRYAAI